MKKKLATLLESIQYFVRETEAHSKPNQTLKMVLFDEIIKS